MKGRFSEEQIIGLLKQQEAGAQIVSQLLSKSQRREAARIYADWKKESFVKSVTLLKEQFPHSDHT